MSKLLLKSARGKLDALAGYSDFFIADKSALHYISDSSEHFSAPT